jgi:hypothetical protein
MAWPPSSAVTSTGLGYNTVLPVSLAWGTDGLLSGAIVTSIRAIKLTEEIKIDNGSGLTTAQILLVDGDQTEFTVIDDRNTSWPAPGTIITMNNPQPNGSGATSETYMTIDSAYQGARKAPGERTIMAKRYLLIPSPANM